VVTEWTAPTENGTMRASEAGRAGLSDAEPRDAEPSDAEPSDAEIIVRSRQEPDRFAQIFDRHAAEIVRYAHTRLGPDRAEDVTAETFLAAFRRRDHYDPAWPEAAQALGLTVSAVRSRLHRIRVKTRAALGGADPTELIEENDRG